MRNKLFRVKKDIYVGDYVTYKGQVFLVDINVFTNKMVLDNNYGQVNIAVVNLNDVRLATKEEIEEYNNQPDPAL